jgi:hypothetical protein
LGVCLFVIILHSTACGHGINLILSNSTTKMLLPSRIS